MASFDQVVQAIADAFEDIPDVHVYLGDEANPQRPAIIVGWPESYDPRAVFGGGQDYTIPCRVEVVASRDWASGNAALRDYIAPVGAFSLIAAIEEDPSLGGVVDSATVTNVDNFGYRDVSENLVVVQCDVNVGVLA